MTLKGGLSSYLPEVLLSPEVGRAEALEMVEREIIESRSYETREHLWERIQAKLNQESFDDAISRLENTGKITFEGLVIIYTGVDNPRLRSVVDASYPF